MLATRTAHPSTMTSVMSLSVGWAFHNGILACGSHEIVLSPLEGKLLSIMMDAHGRVLTHGQIIESLYGIDEPSDPTSGVKSILKRLRPKLSSTPLVVESRRGWGYRVTHCDPSSRAA